MGLLFAPREDILIALGHLQKEQKKALPPRTSYWKTDSEKFVRATLPTAWRGAVAPSIFSDGTAEMKTTSRPRANSPYCQANGCGAEIPM